MRILVASTIDKDALERLKCNHEVSVASSPGPDELIELIRDKEVLILRSGLTVSAQVIDAANALRLVVRAGSGFDNIDIQALERRSIPLARIPRPSSRAVAELALTLMLSLARNVPRADALMRRGVWAKHDLESYLISGKTLGVVGVGNIGRRIAEIGVALGMRVTGCVKHWSEERARELRAAHIDLRDFDHVVSTADFLTLHVPLDDSTRGMIDAEVLRRMKPRSFLVNTSRGGVVIEHDLFTALTTGGPLIGAALDVHEQEGNGRKSPLNSLDSVVLTPHVGAATVDTQREVGREICTIVEEFARQAGARREVGDLEVRGPGTRSRAARQCMRGTT